MSPALSFERVAEQTDALHAATVRRFFENLLPKGKTLDDAALANGLSKGRNKIGVSSNIQTLLLHFVSKARTAPANSNLNGLAILARNHIFLVYV